MSDTTTTTKTGRQASARQIAANRLNCTKSHGAKTEIGRRNSSMNNCSHGLYSTKELLPGECPIERQALVDDITAAAKPVDGLQRLLNERIIKTAWRVRRGERAQGARAKKSVNALVEGGASEAARRADALGATLDDNVHAYHELLTFPAGVTYLLDQWSIILESLSQSLPLLASTRRRCFSLVGKTCEQVLRSDRIATPWFLNLAGSMYGQEATVEDILALLGTEPPEWLQEAEFVTRAQRLRSAVPAQAAAREALKGSVSAIMADLKGKLAYAKEVAERNLELDAAEAAADVTPKGNQLTNAIDKIDRSCLAAIRRLEARQRPQRPGPKGDPNQPATADEALDDLVEPDQAEPDAVAADVQDAVAAEVHDDEPAPVAATTTEADEPEVVDEPDPPSPGEPGPEKCEVEPNSGPAPTETGPEKCEVEADSAPAPAEVGPEKCEVEADSAPAPAEVGPEKCGVEGNSGPAPAEIGAEKCRVEANCGYGIKEPDFEQFGPEADRLRRLHQHLQTTDGTGEPGADPDGTQTDSPLARAMEQRTIRLRKLSRQIDARFGFGINGERPDSS